jgi:hypothetical protein
MSGATVVIGALYHAVDGHSEQGVAYIFNESGGSWSQAAEITSSDGAADDSFGYSVAISGGTVLVGADTHTVGGNADQGAAYVFASNGGSWTQTAELSSSDGAANDYFGVSVAVSGMSAIVGAYIKTVDGQADQGEAYIFTLGGGTWTQSAELTSSDGAAYDTFGSTVSISGTNAIVGASGHSVGSDEDYGAAYVFSTPLSEAPTNIATEDAAVQSSNCTHDITSFDTMNCTSGDFFHTFTDASIPGYGPALDLTRATTRWRHPPRASSVTAGPLLMTRTWWSTRIPR